MSTSTSASSAPKTVTSPTEKRNTLRVAQSSFHTELFGLDHGAAFAAAEGVYEFLVTIDANGKLAPMLADRWERSGDARTWTFYLHKGVQFHDGWGEFTAEDVKFCVEKGREGQWSAPYRNWMLKLDKIEIINPYVVRFHFKAPYIPMADEASVAQYRAIIASRKYYEAVGDEEANRHPIGTGPYKFVEHKKGESVRLEAVTNHWRQTPGFKNLIIKHVPEPGAAVNMLKAGEIDIAGVSPASADELKRAGFRIDQTKVGPAFYVALGGQFPRAQYPGQFDPTIPWVGDPSNPASMEKAYKVRYALASGINREAILRDIFKGAGSLYAVPLYGDGDPWTDPGWKPIPYDPAMAKRLLTEAGYPNGLEFPLWTFTQGGREESPQLAEAVARQWAEIGVKVNVKLTDIYFRYPMNERRVGFAAFTEGMPRDAIEPIAIYTCYFYSQATHNYGIEDPRLDALQDRILAEPDAAKRAALMKQRGQLMIDKCWILPIAQKNLLWAVAPRVGQWKLLPIGMFATNFEYAVPVLE